MRTNGFPVSEKNSEDVPWANLDYIYSSRWGDLAFPIFLFELEGMVTWCIVLTHGPSAVCKGRLVFPI